MAKYAKRSNGRVWKVERAAVTNKNKSRSQSNKYRPGPDGSQRPRSGSTTRYWRAAYTRKDGTKVRGHYVSKS